MYSLIIKPRTILMAKDAYDWYEEQKPGLGADFLNELGGLYNKLSSHPQYFGKIKKNFRQDALKRFPFFIVYEIIKTEIVVFAVFHTSGNPKFKFKD